MVFSNLCVDLPQLQICDLLLNSKLFFPDKSLYSPLEKDRQKCYLLKLDQSFDWHNQLFFLLHILFILLKNSEFCSLSLPNSTVSLFCNLYCMYFKTFALNSSDSGSVFKLYFAHTYMMWSETSLRAILDEGFFSPL